MQFSPPSCCTTQILSGHMIGKPNLEMLLPHGSDADREMDYGIINF